MSGIQQPDPITVLNYGYVKLVGVMTDLDDQDAATLDAQIARAARVSYQGGTSEKRDDAALIDYLLRHRHTSPFEQVVFKFELRMPLFVAQQWIRHRTARLNQESARYSVIADDVYVPGPNRVRGQHANNKQGSGGQLNDDEKYVAEHYIRKSTHESHGYYAELLDIGVARELARIVLPVGTFTSMVWQMDLHNLMHFLSLRLDEHAQWEIRQYAQALYDLVQPLAPLAFASFENHVLNAVTFSGDEMKFIRNAIACYTSGGQELDERLEDDVPQLAASRRRELLAKIGEVA